MVQQLTVVTATVAVALVEAIHWSHEALTDISHFHRRPVEAEVKRDRLWWWHWGVALGAWAAVQEAAQAVAAAHDVAAAHAVAVEA
ncbi:hypothetical protein PG987_009540 [Apiospora arundinis]